MYCSIDNLKKHTALLIFFFLREISRETGALHPSWLKDSNERSECTLCWRLTSKDFTHTKKKKKNRQGKRCPTHSVCCFLTKKKTIENFIYNWTPLRLMLNRHCFNIAFWKKKKKKKKKVPFLLVNITYAGFLSQFCLHGLSRLQSMPSKIKHL